jgi:predicted transcriptional regulator
MMSETNTRGYSPAMVTAVQNATTDSIGVKLGKLCIQKNIPVIDVASFFGVSRQAVYMWFKGQAKPKASYQEKMNKLVAKLSS